MSDLKFITLAELMAQKRDDPLEPRIDAENQCIEFPSSPGCSYFVDFNRCDTHAAILEWVAHLSDKEWATKKHLQKFIVLACTIHKLSLWNGV